MYFATRNGMYIFVNIKMLLWNKSDNQTEEQTFVHCMAFAYSSTLAIDNE